MEATDVRHLTWRPPLVRLTAPWAAEGDPAPQSVFVHPDQIQAIRRQALTFKRSDGTEEVKAITLVIASCFSHHVEVTESPDEVARLRDAAFGIEPPKPKLGVV